LYRGDDLPGGLDLAVFDFAVNSGPARAVKTLQRIVGVPADGVMGAMTLDAVRRQFRWRPDRRAHGGAAGVCAVACDVARLRCRVETAH